MKTKLNFYLTAYQERIGHSNIYKLKYLKEDHTFLHPLYVGFKNTVLPRYMTWKKTLY